MSKRSNFERVGKDFYETPLEAVKPLIPHLRNHYYYIDPCAGSGAIERAIFKLSKGSLYLSCAYDLFNADYSYDSYLADARTATYPHLHQNEVFITNPPWSRELLHPIIENLASQKPTWLLFDADWAHTKQAISYMEYCHKIVSVGRVCWFPETKTKGKDNCCWYLFDKSRETSSSIEFVGKRA